MLRERGKDRKRGRESLLRRIGVKLWQGKEVGGEHRRGRMRGRVMRGGKENRLQTGRRRRSGRVRRGGQWERSSRLTEKNRRCGRKRRGGRRQLVRWSEIRLGVGEKRSRREEVMEKRRKGKETGDSEGGDGTGGRGGRQNQVERGDGDLWHTARGELSSSATGL